MWGQWLERLHTVSFPTVTNQYGVVGTSDCWGWRDSSGTEYAIVGNVNNIAFVRASDGVVLDQVTAASGNDPYYHRDIKTYGHYAYVVGEMMGTNEGLMVIDLSPLPDSVRLVQAWTNGGTLVRAHNLDIDEGTGHLYIESDEFIGPHGVEIVSLADPENPVKVGFISTPGVHDVNARNDTAWVAEGYTKAFSVWDCSDKQNPVLLGRVARNNFGYCHNIWPSDDGRFFFTTEETATKTLKVWDASDLDSIVERGHYLAPNNLAHNVHVVGKQLFVSHYTAGVTVVDWSDPDNPVELERDDTYLDNDNASFHGCWGVYPHSQDSFVYASNFEGHLMIYRWRPTAVGVEGGKDLRKGLAWPNPFKGVVNVPLMLEDGGVVKAKVLDLQGKVVDEWLVGDLNSGRHTLVWRPKEGLTSGVYWVRVECGEAHWGWKVVKE